MAEKSVETPAPNVKRGASTEAALASERHPSAAEQAWERNTLEPTLAKSPERDADFTTVSSYPIRRLYTEADLPNWNPDKDLGRTVGGLASTSRLMNWALDASVTICRPRRNMSVKVIGRTHGLPAQVGSFSSPERR